MIVLRTLEEAINACDAAQDENDVVLVGDVVLNLLYNLTPQLTQGFKAFILIKDLRLAIIEYEQFTSGPAVGIIRGCTN
jgi:sulfur relay (sulfurtransferase) DsrF/TusC family protein